MRAARLIPEEKLTEEHSLATMISQRLHAKRELLAYAGGEVSLGLQIRRPQSP